MLRKTKRIKELEQQVNELELDLHLLINRVELMKHNLVVEQNKKETYATKNDLIKTTINLQEGLEGEISGVQERVRDLEDLWK